MCIRDSPGPSPFPRPDCEKKNITLPNCPNGTNPGQTFTLTLTLALTLAFTLALALTCLTWAARSLSLRSKS